MTCESCRRLSSMLNTSIEQSKSLEQQTAIIDGQLTTTKQINDKYRTALIKQKAAAEFNEQQKTQDKAKEVAADVFTSGIVVTMATTCCAAHISPQAAASIAIIGTATTVVATGIAYGYMKAKNVWNSFFNKPKGD